MESRRLKGSSVMATRFTEEAKVGRPIAGAEPSGDKRRSASTFGGGTVVRSFLPSSKRACVAVLTRTLSTS